ncbi:MAG: hypothetical protein V3T07_07410, partial [Myxococcota bacterium]
MTDRLDEADLLALIEGELDPDRAADLRRRLEADPQTRALVEGLGRDRDVLRSAPDPMVPRDFLADLEPLLARRMLTEVPVGEFRRRHARRQWPRWTTLAAAAMLAIALLAGVWALGTGLLGPGSTPADNLIAFGDPEADLQASAAADHARARKTDRRAGEPGDPDPSAPTRGTIHHHKPSDGAAEAFAPFAVADRDDDQRRAGLDSPAPGARGPVVADFALFVFNDDEDLAEQAVQEVVAELGDRTALVRNFSYEEAERLERQWRIASSGRGRRRAEPAEAAAMDSMRSEMAKVVDRKSRRYEKLADLARQQFREQGRGRADEAKLSEQLHGPPDRAPSLERQLELSRLGATHTIAIRVSQLNDLLARLTVGSGQTTALRMLPGPEEE